MDDYVFMTPERPLSEVSTEPTNLGPASCADTALHLVAKERTQPPYRSRIALSASSCQSVHIFEYGKCSRFYGKFHDHNLFCDGTPVFFPNVITNRCVV